MEGARADLGGGPYRRPAAVAPSRQTFLVGAYPATAPPANAASTPATSTYATLSAALTAWKAWATAQTSGAPPATIRIVDSRTYTWGGSGWTSLAAGACNLTIEAASGQRPCVTGNLALSAADGARVRIDGLLWAGRLVAAGPMALELVDLTLKPVGTTSPPVLAAPSSATRGLRLLVQRSVVGALRVSRTAAALAVDDSIVDGSAAFHEGVISGPYAATAMTVTVGFTDGVHAVSGLGAALPDQAAPPIALVRTTVLGQTLTAALAAGDTLFAGRVRALSTTELGLRYCFVPDGSTTPPRICGVEGGPGPTFASRAYGSPWYAVLDGDTPAAIVTGASNGAEIGVFQSRGDAARTSRLSRVLTDACPVTLSPLVFLVT